MCLVSPGRKSAIANVTRTAICRHSDWYGNDSDPADDPKIIRFVAGGGGVGGGSGGVGGGGGGSGGGGGYLSCRRR